MQRPQVPLVGRREELSLLLDAFERARSGPTSQLVTVVGEPGIGKSRLILELASEVDASPETMYWRQGRSLPYGAETPYWALSEIVKVHAGILRTDDPAVTEEKLRQAIRQAVPEPAEAEWVIGHMRPLVGLPGDAKGGGNRRSGDLAAWRRFFEGRRPLCRW